jgi:hypothetical protein
MVGVVVFVKFDILEDYALLYPKKAYRKSSTLSCHCVFNFIIKWVHTSGKNIINTANAFILSFLPARLLFPANNIEIKALE